MEQLVPGTNVKMRGNETPEKLNEMTAHEGKCRHCGSAVKMSRSKFYPYRLRPDCCFCILCGQRYWMEIENIKAWEREQWKQKGELNG
jgi:hypothetical protein